MSGSSAAEARIAQFRFASGAIYVGIHGVGPPGSVVVSSSASPTKRTGPSYVHWDGYVIHAARRVRGVEAVWILLVVERPVRVALKVSLEVCKCTAVEPSGLKLWARDVGRVAALLF